MILVTHRGNKLRFPDADAFGLWFRHSAPSGVIRVVNTEPEISPLARFKSHTEPGLTEFAGSRCEVYTTSINEGGYGMFYVDGRRFRAHRWIYEQEVGPIPDGLVLDHLCRNPACVNTAHLEAVTQAENKRRSNDPSAVNARKTHCKYGHEFTPENTTWYRNGTSRSCNECQRNRNRSRRWAGPVPTLTLEEAGQRPPRGQKDRPTHDPKGAA